MTMPTIAYPEVVNDVAARTVAAMVAATAVLTVVTQWWVGASLMGLGFLVAVGFGPGMTPYGRLAIQVAPRLAPARPVPGPPKRFAAGLGAAVTLAAAGAAVVPLTALATALLLLIAVLAGLEAGLGFCLGCAIFARLMRVGVIPQDVCVACSDITRRAELRVVPETGAPAA